ncbi:MAG: tetratricopeptide repeat protein, partial [Caulobacteraceae bacterium]|nr:tetratricopeptide repeat protein [Caulobacteraceae bacterium]
LALRVLGRPAEAEGPARRALALDSKLVDRLLGRARTASSQSLRAAAIGYCDAVLALDPDHVAANSLRAVELMLLKRMDEAAAAVARTLALNPDDDLALYVRGQLALQSCDWDAQGETLALMRRMCAEGQVSMALSAFTFMCFDTSPAEQLACARLSAQQIVKAVGAAPQPPARVVKAGEKIRLAYLSGDFSLHATTWLMAGLIEHHDRGRFEVIGLSNGPVAQDAMRQRLTGAFDRFVDIREMDDGAVVGLMRDAGVDIAIDLKGYTQNHRAEVFARRPAPVQVNFLGYPGTMGAEFIDYIVADAQLIAPAEEAFYAEKVVRMPDTYQVNTPRPETAWRTTRAEQGLPEGALVFASFNNSYKITRPVFDIWMRLIKAAPGSVLWLLGDNAAAVARLRGEAEARGVEAGRLVFAERMEQAQHLARQELADLFLDTVPVNAHTTASDALWSGLPVLTCKGRAFIGRVAASVLSAADMPELIVDDLAAYEALALELANDRPRLAAMRARLTQGRDRGRLFDTARFTRHLEAAFETMQARAQAGLAPEAFCVPAET